MEPAAPGATNDTDAAPQVPNASRIYSYTLGGSHHHPVDRAAAEYMFSLVPSTRKWVRMLRDALQESARRLHAEGFRHFVDFASGLPTEDHIHAVVPDSKVVYSDVDPETLEAARALVGHLPNVLYLRHDVREARTLLERPEVTEFLGGERRVALGMHGISPFLPPAELSRVFGELYEWAAPGSRLYVTYETKEPGRTTEKMEQFLDVFRQVGAPFWLYTPQEAVEASAPWRIPGGALVPLREFLGLPEGHITDEDREDVGLEFYAAILEKPE